MLDDLKCECDKCAKRKKESVKYLFTAHPSLPGTCPEHTWCQTGTTGPFRRVASLPTVTRFKHNRKKGDLQRDILKTCVYKVNENFIDWVNFRWEVAFPHSAVKICFQHRHTKDAPGKWLRLPLKRSEYWEISSFLIGASYASSHCCCVLLWTLNEV